MGGSSTTTVETRPRGPIAVLRGEFANPLFRNAYALMLNVGLTGLLGAVYWLLAARLYTPADFGRNSAESQALMFVGGVTILNFVLIRFIPQTARRTRHLVLVCYAIGAVAAALLALGFLLTVGRSASFRHLQGWGPGLAFIAMAVAWNLFNQQEGAFIGLRRASWVPAVNICFGLSKLILVVALAGALPHDGIVLAWYATAAVVLIPTNALIFRRLIPTHAADNVGRGARPTYTDIIRYTGGGYVGGSLEYAGASLVPVVVAIYLAGATQAYFQLAWAQGLILDLLTIALSHSLTAEGAFDRSVLSAATRAALRRSIVLLIPVILVILVAAPFVLSLFGPGYSTAAPMLQLLGIALLPKALIELYIGVLRVQSRTRLIAAIQGLRLAGVLAGVVLFTDPAHLYTIGLVVLGMSVAVALAVLPALIRATRAAEPVEATP